MHAEDDLMWIGTKLGVTLFDNKIKSFDFLLPQGHDLNEMVMVGEGDSSLVCLLLVAFGGKYSVMVN